MPRVRVISDSILRCLCRHILSYRWGAVFPRTRWNQALFPPHLVEVEVEIHRVTVWFFTLTIFYPRGSFPLIHWFPSIHRQCSFALVPDPESDVVPKENDPFVGADVAIVSHGISDATRTENMFRPLGALVNDRPWIYRSPNQPLFIPSHIINWEAMASSTGQPRFLPW